MRWHAQHTASALRRVHLGFHHEGSEHWRARASVSTRWSWVSPTWRSVAPVRCASICIGTITLWCSATDTMICGKTMHSYVYAKPGQSVVSELEYSATPQ